MLYLKVDRAQMPKNRKKNAVAIAMMTILDLDIVPM